MDNDTASKQQFKDTVARMTSQLQAIDAVYPPIIAAAEPHDRRLAELVRACRRADHALAEYIRSKAERGEALPPGTAGLLLNR